MSWPHSGTDEDDGRYTPTPLERAEARIKGLEAKLAEAERRIKTLADECPPGCECAWCSEPPGECAWCGEPSGDRGFCSRKCRVAFESDRA